MSNARNLANLLGTGTQIKTAKVADEVFQANESLIINGDMAISQRGTSETTLGNGNSGYHTIDRFRFTEGGTPTCEFTMSQSTTAPTGFSYSLKMECTTADATPATNDQIRVEQRIEAQNLQHLDYGISSAKSITLSFWVRSNLTGTYVVWFYQDDDARSASKTYTIDTAGTWEYKTITLSGDQTGVIDNDNGNGLQVNWNLVAGDTYTTGTANTDWQASVNADRWAGQNVNMASSTSNEWYLTGVKLEVGSAATPFLHESFGENLAKCQRYFEKVDTGYWTPVTLGQAFQNRKKIAPIHWKVSKRATPTCPDITLTIDGGDGTHLFTASEITKDAVGYTSSTSSPSIGTSDIAFIDAADTITGDAEL